MTSYKSRSGSEEDTGIAVLYQKLNDNAITMEYSYP